MTEIGTATPSGYNDKINVISISSSHICSSVDLTFPYFLVKTFVKLFHIPTFQLWATWWRVFQKRVVRKNDKYLTWAEIKRTLKHCTTIRNYIIQLCDMLPLSILYLTYLINDNETDNIYSQNSCRVFEFWNKNTDSKFRFYTTKYHQHVQIYKMSNLPQYSKDIPLFTVHLSKLQNPPESWSFFKSHLFYLVSQVTQTTPLKQKSRHKDVDI
jgi:hypothetical protein